MSITLTEYLFKRLHQLGCKSLHGLPGDFNLLALDFVEPSGLRWVGNCNELNAGYAADAYARVTGLGAIITTFGVGELSAVNAIAGAYAELAPVVHIVGTPPREAQQNHLFLHHTLGNGDYDVFTRIHKEITIAQADLIDVDTAPSEIDRVLRICCVESRPVYIQLPTDMVTKPVDASRLDSPISIHVDDGDATAEKEAKEAILQRIYKAQSPVILVDGAVRKRRIVEDVRAFTLKMELPVFAAPMGKGSVDETLPFFRGLYAGAGSDPAVREEFEKSDLIITIGNIQSDLNTAGFTAKLPKESLIALHNQYCAIGHALYQGARFRTLIPKLTEAFERARLTSSATDRCVNIESVGSKVESESGSDITHKWLWPRLSGWLREGDILVTDTGTSYVGYWSTAFPRDVHVINQILWSSIGFGVGAAQGASLAAKEEGKGRRTICFEGDGSFQLTAQELSTMIRHDLDVTMFLIENDGYTIAKWKYAEVPKVFTLDDSKVKTWKLSSREELDRLLEDPTFANGKGLQFVEMRMERLDAPQVLKDFGADAAERAS